MFWFGLIVGLIIGAGGTTALFVYVINKNRMEP
jgi:hypothetical protein